MCVGDVVGKEKSEISCAELRFDLCKPQTTFRVIGAQQTLWSVPARIGFN